MPQTQHQRYQCPDCHKPLFEDHVHHCQPAQTKSVISTSALLQRDCLTKFQLLGAEKKSDALLQLRT